MANDTSAGNKYVTYSDQSPGINQDDYGTWSVQVSVDLSTSDPKVTFKSARVDVYSHPDPEGNPYFGPITTAGCEFGIGRQPSNATSCNVYTLARELRQAIVIPAREYSHSLRISGNVSVDGQLLPFQVEIQPWPKALD